MKPFVLKPRQARQHKRDLDSKDKHVAASMRALDRVLKAAVAEVYASYQRTGKYKAPDLSGIDKVIQDFYRGVVSAAVSSCKAHSPRKRLAANEPPNLPNGKKAIDRVFKNKDFWRRIIARSDEVGGKVKEKYLESLKRRFVKVLPLLERTDAAPAEIKQKIEEAWQVTQPRAETIFRTETTKYFASAQVAYYEDSDEIIGFLFDSVRDTSRTEICKSRHGMIFRPGTKLLERNIPPCFLGHTPVLTAKGWSSIDTLIVGDYVWTHANRWRRVTQIHRTAKKSVDVLQIGYAMATPNHPYLRRSGDFVDAVQLRPGEGVWAVPGYLRGLRQGILAAVLSSQYEILRHLLSPGSIERHSKRALASMFRRGQENLQGWLRVRPCAGPPRFQFPGLRAGAPAGDGVQAKSAPQKIGSRAPHKRDQGRQPAGEPAGHVERAAHEPAHQGEEIRAQGPEANAVYVYNLDVEGDSTYVAGGFVVHNCHYNCRSALIPLANDAENRAMLKETARDPAQAQLIPLPRGWRS